MLLRSLKHYAVNLFVEDLGKVPSKEIRFKNNNQDWFDRKVVDLIHVREKLFLKFKKSKLHIDEEIYKKIMNQAQKLIREKSEISMKLTLSKK